MHDDFLTILEGSSNDGERTVILRVFSVDKELCKVIVSGGEVVGGDDLSSELCELIKDFLESKKHEIALMKVFEFALGQAQIGLRVVGESLESSAQLYVFGAGHVGQAVAAIGALVGYNVIVVDDRGEFLGRERFPNVSIRLVKEKYDRISASMWIPSNSAVVIVTRGHQYDEICLEQILKTEARYIGMIGSRRRVLSIFDRLLARGVRGEALKRVHAPIGIKIGAVSPQEIAVAIIAEVISVMNGMPSWIS